ncbi:ATP phosphoribosyltransferase [Halorussus sp. MSC15.2]|uniref:ATP phosphoribosyltransferase n=1 Tax=Halorussus sp. MSC15.2 TaxID=2283638 RepID=UPI0013D5CEB8|nr:ATP phosphoribosyltransferase [Halorussus sp. MSC15.2]NEU55455.1 ATP phosphoribosyltransferase [Halorussus sp. MSC15.2]
MRIAVPNKGRLHDPAMELLESAGLHAVDGADRKLYADTVDPEVTLLFARAADIPEYVSDGAADAGITGLDQAREADTGNIESLLDLGFGQCRLVLAAPEDGDIRSVADVAGKTVATEFPNIARQYFEERDVDVDVVEVSGATELTPHVEMADAIIDITSTGTTLKVNRLAIVDEVLSSSVHLFARDDVADDEKVQQVVMALQSVLSADGKRYLMMNAPEARLEEVRDVIPGLGGPTVMNVESEREDGADGDAASEDDAMVAVHAVVDERDVFETINELKSVGASGILVTEIERLVE